MKKYALYLAWITAFLATIVPLYAAYVLHWVACDLCWYQRTMMYPMFVIFTVAILKDIQDLKYFTLPLAYIGAIIALFHTLLQYGVVSESLAPCTNGVSCTIPYHFFYNWLTLPLVSLMSFIIIIVCMHVYRKENND